MDKDRLQKMGLDCALVTEWHGRPKRQRKAPPLTYWQEFVETDDWYVNEILADVPEDELKAAIEDSDFDEDENSEVCEEESLDTQDEDPDFSEPEEGDGEDSVSSGSGSSMDEHSEGSDVSEGGDDDSDEPATDTASDSEVSSAA